MRIENSLPPTTLTLITTYKCTASCSNCCFDCKPNRREKLPLEVAISHINNAIDKFNSIEVVALTGGECFIDMDYLITLIKEVHSHNRICRVVTNGFWAKSPDIATQILRECIDAGLDEINFSTGDDHLEYVCYNNIVNGICAALDLGLTVVVNIESGSDRNFKIEKLLQNRRISDLISNLGANSTKFSIMNGVWMPFTKESLSRLPLLNKNVPHPCKERCSNLFNAITISPDNRLFACCGLPVRYIKHLDLGNLYKYSIDELYSNQFNDFIKIWLYVDGPYNILSFIEQKIQDEIPECRVLSHTCFYCAALFTNPFYLSIAAKYYKEVFSSIMLRYSFLIKTFR